MKPVFAEVAATAVELAEVCYLVYHLSENALDKFGNFSFIYLFGVSQLSSAGTRKVIADTI